MSTSSASSTASGRTIIFNGERIPVKICLCEKEMLFRTHWEKDDPGRRYHVCPTYGPRRCGLHEWYDPPMCEQSKKIIPALLRKLDAFKRGNAPNEGTTQHSPNAQLDAVVRYKEKVKELKFRNHTLTQELANSTRTYRWIITIIITCCFAIFMSAVKA